MERPFKRSDDVKAQSGDEVSREIARKSPKARRAHSAGRLSRRVKRFRDHFRIFPNNQVWSVKARNSIVVSSDDPPSGSHNGLFFLPFAQKYYALDQFLGITPLDFPC
jgi:hypothetical protein